MLFHHQYPKNYSNIPSKHSSHSHFHHPKAILLYISPFLSHTGFSCPLHTAKITRPQYPIWTHYPSIPFKCSSLPYFEHHRHSLSSYSILLSILFLALPHTHSPLKMHFHCNNIKDLVLEHIVILICLSYYTATDWGSVSSATQTTGHKNNNKKTIS